MKGISSIIETIKEYRIAEYLLSTVFVLYIFIGYEESLKELWDVYVVKHLAKITSNGWLVALCSLSLLFVYLDIKNKFKNRYIYDAKCVYGLAITSFILVYYRISDSYVYLAWLFCITYVDVVILICLCHVFTAIVNYVRSKLSQTHKSQDDSNNTIIIDSPILSIKDDVLGLEDEVHKLAKEISCLRMDKTWSVAIIAPWGAGKTSFMNMVIEQLEKQDKIDIVRFNPRDSKSYKSIQEDFFTTITSALSKYDSRCNVLIKDYMASLQLIDNRQIIERAVNFYKIWDKNDLKEQLTEVFNGLKKSILVFIDDFDRLSKDEILEVLKLIDSNAAFNNLIFFTAYDKEQVNKSLGESYKTKDACFVDKFFMYEYHIPSRPYSFILNYINKAIRENVCEDEKVLSQLRYFFQEYVPTLRDAKRFINQIKVDYQYVKGDVYIDEFFLVQMIKYKYPQQYKALFNKKYIEDKSLITFREVWYLKKDIDEDAKAILPVLHHLFPVDGDFQSEKYRHIYDMKSFDNYFINQISGALRIEKLNSVFYEKREDVFVQIDRWLENEDEMNDLVAFLSSKNMDEFANGALFLRYAEVVTYLATRYQSSRTMPLFYRLIYKPNLDGYKDKYNLVLDDYKESLLNIISDIKNDDNLSLAKRIHYGYVTLELNHKEELITDEDIWPTIKSYFISTAINDNEEKIISWLYDCSVQMELPSRMIRLDSDCLKKYKEHITKAPEYYLSKFVRLGMQSNNPEFNTVSCEPFWRQIFGNETDFENWLTGCLAKKIERSSLVDNFWKLYKANGYNPISFENQGNVQDKIDSGLVEEVKMLTQLQGIENRVSQIPFYSEELSSDDLDSNKEKLSQLLDSLGNIKLYIKLNGSIRETLKSKMDSYSSINF